MIQSSKHFQSTSIPRVSNIEKSSNTLRPVIDFSAPPAFAGRKIKLVEEQTIFGREMGDIRIPDPQVSSTHCQIQHIGEDFIIFDMNSSNGTFVNDEKITKHVLVDHDEISIGNTKFTFLLLSSKETRALPSASKHHNNSSEHAHVEKTRIVDTLLEKQSSKKEQVLEIKVTYSDGSKETHTILKDHVQIGRGTSFGRFHVEKGLSRIHVSARLNEVGEIVIEDHGSTNGTYINDTRIHGLYILKTNDKIRIGLLTLTIKAILK